MFPNPDQDGKVCYQSFESFPFNCFLIYLTNCFFLPLFQAHHFRLYIRPCFCKGEIFDRAGANREGLVKRMPTSIWSTAMACKPEDAAGTTKNVLDLMLLLQAPEVFRFDLPKSVIGGPEAQGLIKLKLVCSVLFRCLLGFDLYLCLSSSKRILTNRETPLTLHVQVSTNRTPTRQKPFVAIAFLTLKYVTVRSTRKSLSITTKPQLLSNLFFLASRGLRKLTTVSFTPI